MVDLGVLVQVSSTGITLLPPLEKREKWIALIRKVLLDDELCPQLAGSLAGKLSWSCTSIWNKCGREFIRCLFKRQHEFTHCLTNELRDSLEWWLKILPVWPAAVIPWDPLQRHLFHLYADASLRHQTLAWILSPITGPLTWSSATVAVENPAPFFYWELAAAVLGFICTAPRVSG